MHAYFDPYQAWLGIPPHEQPPHHYRLLGVNPFEPNQAVLEAAVARQLALLRSAGQGAQAHRAQELIAEITAVGHCLLNPTRRAAYDAQLARQLGAPGPLPVAMAAPTAASLPTALPVAVAQPPAPTTAQPQVAPQPDPPLEFLAGTTPRGKATRARRAKDPGKQRPARIEFLRILFGGVAGVIIALLLVSFVLRSRPATTTNEIEPATQPNSATPSATPSRKPSLLPAGSRGAPAQEEEVILDLSPYQDLGNEDPFDKGRLPVPSEEELAPLREQLAAALNSSTATELIDRGRRDFDPPTRHLLVSAGIEQATDEGDVETAFRGLESLYGSFEIDPLSARLELLETFAEQANDFSALEHLQLTQQGLEITRFLREDERLELAAASAEITLRCSRESGSPPLARAATVLLLELHRVHPPAEPPSLGNLSPPQLLAAEPAHPRANFHTGREYCFEKGDWQRGIPYLALGTHEEIRAAARAELGVTLRVDDLVDVADLWWQCAASLNGQEQISAQQRAGFWYALAATLRTEEEEPPFKERFDSIESLQEAYPLIGTRYLHREPTARALFARHAGGSLGTELAVEQGLTWLAKQQKRDGSWDFTAGSDPGMSDATLAATSLGLLPFLGAGNSHQFGPYQESVNRGLSHLLANLQTEGTQGAFYDSQGVLSHALATLVLAELYGMTGDAELKRPLRLALVYLNQSQDATGGGWNLTPGGTSDLTVTGWVLMALKSAHLAELPVPTNSVAGVRHLLGQVQTEDGARYGSAIGVSPPSDDQRTTAVGLLCRVQLDWAPEDPAVIQGLEILSDNPPSESSLYYTLFGSQVLRLHEGIAWDIWNASARQFLLASQTPTGYLAGSWHFPEDEGGRSFATPLAGDLGARAGGRLYSTAMSLLILETYYRYTQSNT